MNCLYCEQEASPGGTRLVPISASALCSVCGRAVCSRHGKLEKREDPGRTKCLSCIGIAEPQARS